MTEKITLTELQLIIRDSLYMALPDFFWVTAEISELRENSSGHCYLELVEKISEDKNPRARIRAIIWSTRFRFLKAFFENSTSQTLREGIKILIKVKVEYHELYGLSLIISDIDPAFTIGDMAMKRQLILAQLDKEGVLLMNKELQFPPVPQRIAIISSRNAAGYTDFMNHLKGNSFGYVFYTTLIEASLQGKETEQDVIGALDTIASNQEAFDVVVLIRGGGSQSDLSWFDSYNIAYHITQFPLPVITGIGHEKDVSVTDLVAHTALKTPTAVADFLIDSVADTENRINEISRAIAELSKTILERNRNKIDTASIRLLPMTRLMLSEVQSMLSSRKIDISNSGKAIIFRASLIAAKHNSRLIDSSRSLLNKKSNLIDRKLDTFYSAAQNLINTQKLRVTIPENRLQLLNPENVLMRGYTITSLNGKILKKGDSLNEEDIIDTQFFDVTVKSRVLKKTGKK
jgi:exodeoxyribonuclease VII large subunit